MVPPEIRSTTEIGLIRLGGPVGPCNLFEWFPGDALGLTVGGSDIPGQPLLAPGCLAQLGQGQIRLAESAAGRQHAEAAITAKHLPLRRPQEEIHCGDFSGATMKGGMFVGRGSKVWPSRHPARAFSQKIV